MTIPLFGSDIPDLGTQVFIYEPGADPVPTLTEITDAPGFGDPANKYTWTAQLFDGDDADDIEELYVGTFNVELDYVGVFGALLTIITRTEAGGFGTSDLLGILNTDLPKTIQSNGGEIWKYDFVDQTWTEMVNADHPSIDDGDAGFREMASFNGQIFASTSRGLIYNVLNASNNPAKILVSSDGENWEELTGGPLDPDAGNSSIRSMEVIKGPGDEDVLLVGTENTNGTGAQLWTYDKDGEWTFVTPAPALTHAETFTFEGDVYIGTWAPYGLYKLDIGGWPPLVDVTPENVAIDDDGVMQMIEFDGYFYIGSVNYGGGTSLFRTKTPMDRESWETITTDGFDSELDSELGAVGVDRLTYTWQMAVVGDTLYIGDFNNENGLLLQSTNGTDFSIVDVTGADGQFGSVAYGVRKLIPVGLDSDGYPDTDIDPNALIIGSADPFAERLPLSSRIAKIEDVVLPDPFGWPDDIVGSDGEDILFGGGGDDEIDGGAEDDTIFGDKGLPDGGGLPGGFGISNSDDILNGQDGNDFIFGNEGSDTIDGGAGEDLIFGGIGGDTLRGGADIDIIFGDYSLFGTAIFDTLLEVLGETDLLPTTGFDLETMDLEDDAVLGSLGVSQAMSLAFNEPPLGDNPLFGGGDFGFFGGSGFFSGFGLFNDEIFGNGGNDILVGGLGFDDIRGGSGNDAILGGDGIDIARGGADEDYVWGDGGRDLLFGNSGDDFLFGGDDNDKLLGGGGDDLLNGDAGDDWLIGGGGEDTFQFDFQTDFGSDMVLDFRSGTDTLEILGFIPQFQNAGFGLDTNGDKVIDENDANVTVQFGRMIISNGDDEIILSRVTSLDASDVSYPDLIT